MATFFGNYFGLIIVFSVLTWIIFSIYLGLISDEMSAKYPEEYQKFYRTGWWSPSKTRRIFEWAKECRDDKLKSLGRKGLFFQNCCISIIIAFPLGMVVFLILKALNK